MTKFITILLFIISINNVAGFSIGNHSDINTSLTTKYHRQHRHRHQPLQLRLIIKICHGRNSYYGYFRYDRIYDYCILLL